MIVVFGLLIVSILVFSRSICQSQQVISAQPSTVSYFTLMRRPRFLQRQITRFGYFLSMKRVLVYLQFEPGYHCLFVAYSSCSVGCRDSKLLPVPRFPNPTMTSTSKGKESAAAKDPIPQSFNAILLYEMLRNRPTYVIKASS